MNQIAPNTQSANHSNVYSIVLCGGSGTRLWPISRKKLPKQFLALGGEPQSLLQATLNRIKNISPQSHTWLVTAQGLQHEADKQVGKQIARTLIEPKSRNTAAAIGWAAWELMQSDPESLMVVLSSDHSIQNVRSFEQSIQDALLLARENLFVTVGIRPTYPATGFGYIELGLPLDDRAQIAATDSSVIGHSVRSFREKPTAAAAEQFLRTGKYLWNAGIFVWKTRTFWNAFSHLQPAMAALLSSGLPLDEIYGSLESLPIDVAFLEQTSHVACVSASFDWNDVGSWPAVRECFTQDDQGNNISGDVFSYQSKNSVIHSTGPFVAAVGCENMVIVATSEAVLVMPASQAQDVKRVIAYLEQAKRDSLL